MRPEKKEVFEEVTSVQYGAGERAQEVAATLRRGCTNLFEQAGPSLILSLTSSLRFFL